MTTNDKFSVGIGDRIDEIVTLIQDEGRWSWVVIEDHPLKSNGVEFHTEPFPISNYYEDGELLFKSKPCGKPPAQVANPRLLKNEEYPANKLIELTGISEEQAKTITATTEINANRIAIATFLAQIEHKPNRKRRAVAINFKEYAKLFPSDDLNDLKQAFEQLFNLISNLDQLAETEDPQLGELRDPIIKKHELSDTSKVAWGKFGQAQQWQH